MCADLKLARLENQPDHMDSWVDLAGYAACGAEIAVDGPAQVIDRNRALAEELRTDFARVGAPCSAPVRAFEYLSDEDKSRDGR
jgi:hypothetical protein